jgi:two-component system, LytTR family, response regulator
MKPDKTFKVIIVEDEVPARNLIMHFLSDHPELIVVSQCTDGFEGATAIAALKPDLIFLDIQMPRITGLEMLELLDEEQLPLTIFTTAYDQFAIKAFEHNAIDYLLKPISKERFDQAVHKAVSKLLTGQVGVRAAGELLQKALPVQGYLEKIVLKSGAGIHVIPDHDIAFIEAMDDYVLIHTVSNEEYLKKKTMKYLQEHLDPGRFLRVHRSVIVAIDAIKKIESYSKDAWIAILHNGKKVPVSKAGYSALRKTFDF